MSNCALDHLLALGSMIVSGRAVWQSHKARRISKQIIQLTEAREDE